MVVMDMKKTFDFGDVTVVEVFIMLKDLIFMEKHEIHRIKVESD